MHVYHAGGLSDRHLHFVSACRAYLNLDVLHQDYMYSNAVASARH